MSPSKGPGVLFVLSWVCICVNAASFYGESYIRVPFQDATKSTQVKLNFKTHRPHGLLLLAAGTTDYFSIELSSGIVQVRVNLGSGEARVQSTPGLRLDDLQWHFIQINRTLGKVILNVDDVLINSADTPGSFHELNIEHGIFLGGIGTFTEVFYGNFKNFRGCQRDVFFNGHEILDAARRLNSPLNSFEILWDCDDEFDAGSDKPISFLTDTSFVAFSHLHIRNKGTVSCDIITEVDNAVVLFNSGRRAAAHDFIALEILNGRFKLSANKGSGVVEVFSDTLVNDGLWHQVDVILSTNLMELRVDGKSKETSFNLGDNLYLNLAGHLFLGGVGLKARSHAIKRGLQSLRGNNGMKGSLVGCMRNIVINKRVYGFREIQISRLVDPHCSGKFPCASDPCIKGAKCIKMDQDNFRCICDKFVCTKEMHASSGSISNVDPGNVLAIEELRVQEGAEVAITSNVIDVIFDYQAFRIRESSIQFHIKVPPRYGRIEINLRRRKNGEKFTLLDLIGRKISYIHDGTDTTSDDVTMEMTLNSHNHNIPEKYRGVFAFVVPITIIPHNDPPKIVLPSGNVLEIIKNTKLQLTKSVLDIDDPDSQPENLRYSVTYLRMNDGFFEHSNNTGTSVTKFTQKEVNSGFIWFVHRGDITSFFRLKVTDGSSSSDAVDLQITAVDMQLHLSKNSGISVFHGLPALISSSNLTSVTNVPAQQIEIRYRIVEPAKYGEVQRRQHEDDSWVSVSSFTQRHIVKERLRYMQTRFGVFPESDQFKFAVTAKDQSLRENIFKIVFHSVKLSLQKSAKLSLLHTTFAAVKKINLFAEANAAVPENQLIYTVVRPPSHGGLFLMKSQVQGVTDFDQKQSLPSNSNFTQADVSQERLYYKVHRPSFTNTDDFIDLKVSFQGSQSVMSRLLVQYIPEPSSVRFTNNGLKEVIEGGQKQIERDDLYLEMDNYKESQFTVMEAPKYGTLKMIEPRSFVVINPSVLKFTTNDIREGKLVYQHDDSEHDKDSFTFTAAPVISTKDVATEIQEFSGVFSISMLMRNDNTPEILVDRVFHVVRNKDRLLTIDDIAFTDPDIEYDTSGLMYTRRGIPNGNILDAGTNTPVYEFTQQDLIDKKLLFRHKGADHSRAAVWVTDGQFVKPFLFEIQASDPYVKILNNTGIMVKKGSHVLISSFNLSIETNVNVGPESVNFVLIEEPLSGHLRIRGKQVSEFMLSDLIDSKVRYWHDGGNEMEDKFKFATVVEGAQVQGVFPIMIFLESQMHPPQVIHNRFLEVPEGSRAVITSSHLHISHQATSPDDIIFTVTSLPVHGLLQVKGKKNRDSLTFSQKDIDMELVSYVPGDENFILDKFVFDVSNGIQDLKNLDFLIEIVPTFLPLIVGNISVMEGGRAPITEKILKVRGRSFKGKSMIFEIRDQPSHGWIDSVDKKRISLSSFSSQDLAQNKIFYEHNSDESITDSFSVVALLADNSKRSLPQIFFVSITSVNDQPPRVVVNTGLEVWQGSVTQITNQNLMAEDHDSDSDEIIFKVSSPSNGHIAFINSTFVPISEFSQKQLDSGLVVFVHSGDQDGKFSFQATDGVNSDILRVFKVLSVPLVLMLQVNKPLHVFPNTLHQITSKNLLAVTSDANLTKPIVFTVKTKPRKGKVVTLMEGRPLEVTSFTQDEINREKIYYHHEGYIPTWTVSDSFMFEVSTAYASPLRKEFFEITVSFGNVNEENLNTLVRISKAFVDEGAEVTLQHEHLDLLELQRRLSQFGRGVSVNYVLVSQPQHGKLLQDGLQLMDQDSFSQARVSHGAISYVHDGSDTTEDFFELAVKIQQPSGHYKINNIGNFSFSVKPINDQPFELVTKNPSLQVIQGSSSNLTSTNLKTIDPDTKPEDIVYNIITGPNNGMLVFWEYPKIEIKMFSQKDVDGGRLVFVHDGTRNAGTFYFKVSDGAFRPYYKIFNIYVIPVKVKIVKNREVELVQSESSVYINNNFINVTSTSKRENIWYNVTMEPSFGRVYFQETPTKYFAQTDIDKERLLYIQTNMSSGSDFFVADIYVKGVDVVVPSQRINITVIPLVKQGPLDAPVGSSSAITKFSLDASELASITGDNPVFGITDPPKHGKIVKNNRGKRSVNTNPDFNHVDFFTHEDIVYTKVYYVADDPSAPGVKSDNFTYTLRANNVQPAEGVFIILLQPPEMDVSTTSSVARVPTASVKTSGNGGHDSTGKVLASTPWQDEKTTPADGGLSKSDESSNPNISNDYVIVAVVVSVVILIIILAVVIVLLLKRKRRQDAIAEQVKSRPKPRPFISGPLQLEQPHVHIEPQIDSPPPTYEHSLMLGHNTASNIPVISVSHDDNNAVSSDKHMSSPPRSPDLSRVEVSQTVPSCKVTPMIEIPESSTEDTSVRSPGSAKSNTSAELFNFDWNLMDPDLLQHCRTTTPVLRKNQYWV